MQIADNLFSNDKYRPFLGISISARPPPLDKSISILKWMLRSSSSLLPILFADEIGKINYRVFGDSEVRASKMVEKNKIIHVDLWKEALSKFTEKERSRFVFIDWCDIVTPKLIIQQDIIRESFFEQNDLYHAVFPLVSLIIRNAGKTVTLQRCLKMAEYVIQELPTLLFGIEFNGINYQMLIYPTFFECTEMEHLIAELRSQPHYSILRDKLCFEVFEFNKLIQMILCEKELSSDLLGLESQSENYTNSSDIGLTC